MRYEIDDLEKAFRSHKYVKRTGGPGNYKYWYKMPDGSVQSPDDAQGQGKIDHAKRLILGQQAGHHSMSTQDIARHVGLEHDKVQSAKRNLARHGTEWRGRTFSHGYEDEHIKEGHKEVPGHEGASHESAPARHEDPEEAADRRAAAAQVTTRRASRARTGRAAGDIPETDEEPRRRSRRSTSTVGPVHTPAPDHPASREAATPTPATPAVTAREMTDAIISSPVQVKTGKLSQAVDFAIELMRDGGRTKAEAVRQACERFAAPAAPTPHETALAARTARAAAVDREIAAADATATGGSSPDLRETQAATSAQADADEEEKLLAKLREHGVNLPSRSETASTRQRAKTAAAVAERARAASPSAPHAAELHAAAPDLAAADAPITRMEAVAARGENPYLARAKEIHHNIVGDLKPERREVCKHVLQAIADLQAGHAPLNEANIVERYKHLSGKRVRGISGIAEDFEKGTFMSLQEIMENKPVDPEVERMKRGYGAKQFARMKPFIKDSWHQANPSAPPPMPTFGDVKSWGEHGGAKPAWAGNTRLAMPQEIHDAIHKGADGKPKYPPAWMPIQMMPTWNYVMKKAGDDSPYQTRNVNIEQGKLKLGNQAQFQEGMVVASLRKYVQMRGGVDQLTDIPSHKLNEVGLTHSDIFKAAKFDQHDLSDATLKKMLRTKIVDPVALMPFIKEVMKEMGKTKKSFSLVVDAQLPSLSFRKSFVVDTDVQKSELIQKIRALKSRRG